MATVFGRSNKRFSIDDAFEEENDEAIKIYGSTTERSPLKPKNRSITSEESTVVKIDDSNHHSESSRLTFTDDVCIKLIHYNNIRDDYLLDLLKVQVRLWFVGIEIRFCVIGYCKSNDKRSTESLCP